MKILFVMEHRAEAGSIQAVANYIRTGDQMGHTVALYGRRPSIFPHLRFSTDVRTFDFVVFIFESRLRWMSGLQLAPVLAAIPRSRRAILDADGMYNPAMALDGYDRNHRSERERLEWLEQYHELAEKILQPTLAPQQPGVMPLLFYGYDPEAQVDSNSSPSKAFDIMHVGHNWWRWQEVSRTLLPAFEQIRAQVNDICFIGAWWDAIPPWAGELNLDKAIAVDGDWFRRLHIQVLPPVPYTQVIKTMSGGRVNIMTQRPLLRYFKHLTSKYFEIFSADTIPLVMLSPEEAEKVYGPAGRLLALDGQISDKLLDALHRPRAYREIAKQVRQYLLEHHSYRRRLQELVAALQA